MPTQIIDGFKLNASTPIDSRLVTTGTASRNTMTYKYDGLRVYDTIQKKPFVYINGDWIEESGGGVTTTTTGGAKIDGTVNSIPKIISTGTTSSNIREYVTGNERRIGINIPESTQIATTLHVGGTVTATNFVGSVAVTNIAGILPLNKIQNANDPAKTYVLKSENNTNKWVLETTGSKIIIDKDTNSEKLFLAFTNDKDITGSGNSLYIVNNGTNDLLAANAKTRQLMVGTNNNSTTPQYSFVDKLGTGMYGTNTEVGLSIEGKKSLYITSTMVGINLNGVTTMKFEPTLTTISNPTTITGTTTINGATTITGTTTISGTNTFTVGTGAVTLGGTLTVGGTMSGKTVVLTPAADKMGISVTTDMTTSPPNNIINTTGTGLYIQSTGEGLRLDNYTTAQTNYISFFGNANGKTKPSGSNTDRRGWLGYGSQNSDTFYLYNEYGNTQINTQQGDINLKSGVGSITLTADIVTTIKSDVYVDKSVYITGAQVRVGEYLKIRDYSKDPGAGTFFGRYKADQDTGDAWIRVDSVANNPNWGGYYSFGVDGKFTTNYLKVQNRSYEVSFYISAQATGDIRTHGLGRIPMVTVVTDNSDMNVVITRLTDTQIRVSNFSSGGTGPGNVTIYCW